MCIIARLLVADNPRYDFAFKMSHAELRDMIELRPITSKKKSWTQVFAVATLFVFPLSALRLHLL